MVVVVSIESFKNCTGLQQGFSWLLTVTLLSETE